MTSDGCEASFVVDKPLEQGGMRVFAGLVSDPFFMDVEAAIRTDIVGKLSFDTAENTVHFRDVLSIVVEVLSAPIVERFDGITLVGAVAETLVTRRGKPIRIERLGRPEIKNVVHGQHDSRSEYKGRRASRSLQSRRHVCALQGISTTLRVASRCEPGVLRWSRREYRVAARTRRTPSIT